MKIGIMISVLDDIEKSIRSACDMGIHSCQLITFDPGQYTDERAEQIQSALSANDMTVSTFWAGWTGPRIWNFTEGPVTLGLLPPAYRYKRVCDLKRGSDFAKKLGINQIATHAGFMPENPHDPLYAGMIDALREVALYCKANGQRFLFETGQETPVALLRAFEDIGTDNLGINFDTGNLILYGKANPVDALDMIGPYVRDLHIKDALYPTTGLNLGKEMPVGDGKANFPAIVARLKELGYDGALTIEREITGEQQTKDILRAKALLESLL